MAKRKKKYSLFDQIDFGKYKGVCIRDLIDRDLGYIQWCVEEKNIFEMNHEAKNYFNCVKYERETKQPVDCYSLILDKNKFLKYLDTCAEDAVLLDIPIVTSVNVEQLAFQF